MNIFTKKMKKEIKGLIHGMGGCYIELGTLEEIKRRVIENPTHYRDVEEYRNSLTKDIVKLKCKLNNIKHRLRELGVY